MFTRECFFDLERRLRDAGLDSDSRSFDEIKSILQNPPRLTPDEFASACSYVILAGGFSQKTAKTVWAKVMDYLHKSGNSPVLDEMLRMFNNKNKINAIIKIWLNRAAYMDGYYRISNNESRIMFLSTLPHIGKITANHLARNLGENVVKYDIWIQRLGVVYAGNPALRDKIDNGNLNPEVKAACDGMFAHLEKQTGLPRGYIDVVLWKACQNHFIQGI
jgi:hypothetical protein